MLRHYLVTAARSLTYHKLYSVINIAGLSIGLAAAILIVLYVRDQLSYDKWIPQTRQLYRLERANPVPGHGIEHSAQCPFPVLTAVGNEISQVRAVTHVVPEQMTVHVGDRLFHEKLTLVDPNFFQVIRLPLVRGDPASVLSQPESIVVSESFARKYFGSADPIGRILAVNPDHSSACAPSDSACLNATYPLRVTGVLRDVPHNTHLIADLIVPNTSRTDAMPQSGKSSNWLASDFAFGYVELAPGANPAAVVAQIGPLLDRLVDVQKFGFSGRLSQMDHYDLTPFQEVHLTSDENGGMKPPGSWTTVYGFAAIAALIVLIACCNVMNLATARASLRSREIALRKLGGAKRSQLVAQFLGEAVLMACVSLAIALSLVEVLLPAFARFLAEPVSLHYASDWRLIAFLVAGAILVGLLGGLYPALVLSGFRPAEALKPGGIGTSGSGMLRAALVVAQFAISIGLGVGAVVVLRQIDYARHIDLGINREGVVVVDGLRRMTPTERESFASALKTNPDIESVAYSRGAPFALMGWLTRIQVPGKPEVDGEILNMSPEFPALYGMRLLAGRLLSSDHAEDVATSDSASNIMINAAMAQRLGLSPQEAVGKRVSGLRHEGGSTIVGVLSNANLRSVRDPLEPMVFYFNRSGPYANMSSLSIRIRGDRAQDTLAFIDRTWRAFEPGATIERYFVSDLFSDYFQQGDREGALLGLFVGIAIFIACLGLFGLAVFTAERRTKEIGVRKIAGARTTDIVGLMLWRISVPVLIANVVAWPVVYHYLRQWLDGYAYRISLSPLYFLLGGAAALAIAWATVFAHTLRLARSSPVHALRYE